MPWHPEIRLEAPIVPHNDNQRVTSITCTGSERLGNALAHLTQFVNQMMIAARGLAAIQARESGIRAQLVSSQSDIGPRRSADGNGSGR